MNARRLAPPELETALQTKLRELLGSVSWLEGVSIESHPPAKGYDFLVKLPPLNKKPAELWVECKSEPRPSQFPYVYTAPEGEWEPVKVLAAPYISPRMAQVCQQERWSWFDLAGNYFLDVPGLLRLQHTGNPPVHQRPPPRANLSTREAGRVIRALLLPAHAGMRWTQRHLADHFGELKSPIPQPSLGLVNKVVRHLREEAFIEDADSGVVVRDPLKLLFVWRDAYRFDRHDRRPYFTLLQGRALRDALANLGAQTGGYAAYASFSAADFQAPHVRQPKTWLFIRPEDLPTLEKLAQAKPVDSGENLVVLLPDDEGVFYLGDGGALGDHRLACTNLVQTYVDLWHSGGRGQEAAEALLEQRLKPEWRGRGLKV